MDMWSRNRIRTRLALLFILSAILPLLFAGSVLVWQGYRTQQQEARQNQQLTVQRTMERISDYFDSAIGELSVFANLYTLQQLDDETIDLVLGELIDSSLYFDSVHITNVYGLPLAYADRQDSAEPAVFDAQWVPMLAEFQANRADIYFGALKYANSTREPILPFGMAMRNSASGEVENVLLAEIRLRPIWDLVTDLRTSPSEVIYVLDEEGNVIAHSDPLYVLQGRTMTLPDDADQVVTGLDGRTQVFLLSEPILAGNRGLRVVVETDTSAIIDPALRAAQIIAIVMGISMLAAIALSLVSSHQIVGPLETLAAGVRKISAGGKIAPVPVTGQDEIAELAVAFNRMTVQLGDTMTGLEQKIVELEEADSALRKSEEQVRELIDGANDIIYLHDLEGNFISVNRAGLEISGFTNEEVRATSIVDVLHPDDLPLARRMMAEQLLEMENSKSRTYEMRIFNKAGEVVVLEIRARVIFENGEAIAFQGIGRDISQRVRALEALRQSEDRFRQLAESIQEVFWMTELDGRYLYVSPPFEKIWGVPLERIYADPRTWQMAVHPDDRAAVQEVRAARLLQGDFDEIYRIVRIDGTVRWIRERAFPIIGTAGDVQRVAGVAEDITERRLAEERLQQSEKLESIGLLAGGVAHDFNNLLTGFLGQTSLALLKLGPDDPARRHIEKAVMSAERASDLTRQLLAYAGKGKFQIEQLQLNDMVHENVGLLQTATSRHVAIELDLAENLALVEADRGQIQQVLMNLVINAAESIEHSSGTVAVKTANIVLGADEREQYLGADGMELGHYVLLEVVDTGVGMDPVTLASIFDPFFTTKETGKGLGLSSTLGIIHAHQGGLQVTSEVGVGTRIVVLLPAAKHSVAVVDDSKVQWQINSIKAKVLVIDDEAPVRETVRDMLSLAGIDVLEARDGAEGVEIFRACHDELGVVLLDMKMPVMDGEEAFFKLREIDAGVTVIVSSGYAEEEATLLLTKDGRADFLQKPYDVERLMRKIQGYLANRPANDHIG